MYFMKSIKGALDSLCKAVVLSVYFRVLSNFIISDEKLLKAIRALNVNKAHGWDGISVQIINVCDSSLLLPLK